MINIYVINDLFYAPQQKEYTMADIGKPRRTIEIDPVEVPDSPAEIPVDDPAREPNPVEEPEKVPVDV